MLRFDAVHDLCHFICLEQWFAAVKNQRTVGVLPAELVQNPYVVADAFGLIVIYLSFGKIIIHVFSCLTKTVGALKIALGGQYDVEERGFSLFDFCSHCSAFFNVLCSVVFDEIIMPIRCLLPLD